MIITVAKPSFSTNAIFSLSLLQVVGGAGGLQPVGAADVTGAGDHRLHGGGRNPQGYAAFRSSHPCQEIHTADPFGDAGLPDPDRH